VSTGYSDQPLGRSSGPADIVAGFLAAFAIFFSVIGIAWHPLRLIPISMAFALVAVGLGRNRRRLTLAATAICAVCFFLGMVVAVLTNKPLW
jgi:hypothetical protein